MADTGQMRFLKRFPESKHEQIRQLMSYIEMCGVSGKDLVSIGGHIDRRRMNEQYQNAKARVKEFIDQKTIQPIGKDRADQIVNRFKYKGISGDYNLSGDWRDWEIVSVKTKVKQHYHPSNRDWPGHLRWNRRAFYDMVLDIAEGRIQLNF